MGVPPPQGGPEELVLFAVLKEGSASNGVSESALLRAFTEELRQKLNPLFKVLDLTTRPSGPDGARQLPNLLAMGSPCLHDSQLGMQELKLLY